MIGPFVVASANPHKVGEIRELWSRELPGIELVGRPAEIPDVEEHADSLLGNALLKAHAIASAANLPAIADDTGLFVDALGGRPGVRTARFAGRTATDADNRAALLAALDAVEARRPEDRTASFRTIAVAVWPNGDPLFCPHGHGGLTFSELGPALKQQISHRARAFTALAWLLP
jgi:XTP/dITP diphosphohydrolase